MASKMVALAFGSCLEALWEKAGVDGGPPCIGNFFMCKCKGCNTLKEKVDLDGQVLFNEGFLGDIHKRYVTKRAGAALTKSMEKFERVVECFVSKMQTLEGGYFHFIDYCDEMNEILRAFIQRERSLEGTRMDLRNLMQIKQDVDDD